jgi:hypothetical protein
MALTFDTVAKRIVLDSTNTSATAIYSAWVDWIAVGDNLKYSPAFRSVGGDDLGGGLSIPPYYFLSNGWLVRPVEANQTLTITGNLFVDGGGDPVVSTLGIFNVLTKLVVPTLAMGISTSGGSAGPSASEIAAAVLSSLMLNTIPVDMQKVNGQLLIGEGTAETPWGPGV